MVYAALLFAFAAPIVILGLLLFTLGLCKTAQQGDEALQKRPTIASCGHARPFPWSFSSPHQRMRRDSPRSLCRSKEES
jgi:hypothetical protein